jgi:hypothetical protein
MKKWFKKKIQEMSAEYKYNFFLRIALELYLEVFILSLLNIRHSKFDNFWQVLSLCIAAAFVGILTFFLVWSVKFS